MRIRLLFAAVAALALAACNDSSSAPRLSPTKPARDVSCRSGYHIATREDGTESCEEDKDTFDQPAAAVPLAPRQ